MCANAQGAELTAAAAMEYEAFDSANSSGSDTLAGVPSRPDFVGLMWPGWASQTLLLLPNPSDRVCLALSAPS